MSQRQHNESKKTLRIAVLWVIGVGICLWGVLSLIPFAIIELPPEYKEFFQKAEPPEWVGEHTAVDVSQYVYPPDDRLEFATNDKYLLLWSVNLRETGQGALPDAYTKTLGKSLVLNFRGEHITEATDEDGQLRSPYIDLFPQTSYRSVHAEFIKNAENWGLSPDGQYGVKTIKRLSNEGYLAPPHSIQLWNLGQATMHWELDVAEMYELPFVIEFVVWEQQECVLLVSFNKLQIVSRETGDVLGKHMFDGGFSAFSLATTYNRTKRWLVCGEFGELGGRRVRVYSIDLPFTLLSEVMVGASHHAPSDGIWHINRLMVSGNGEYLVAQYRMYSGRFIARTSFPTDVYDTGTWELVWYEDMADVHTVTISPDGERMAFLRESVLEIGEFKKE
jgi:hypothetical protein